MAISVETRARAWAVEETPDSGPTTFIPSLLSTVLKGLPTPAKKRHFLTRVITLQSDGDRLLIRQEHHTIPDGTIQDEPIRLMTLGGGGLPPIKLEFYSLDQLLEDACQKDPSSLSIRAEGNPPTAVVFSSPDGSRRALGTWAMPKPTADNNP